MRVLTRYVTVEFLRTLGASFVAFLLMFVMIDFLERVDGFVQRGAPLQTTISYFLNRIPDLVFEMIPICMLVATSVCVGRMMQANEITAMKAGGISLYRAVVWPIFVIGFGVSFLCMGVNELAVPWTKERSRQILDAVKRTHRDPNRPVETREIWFHDRGEVLHVRDFFQEIEVLRDVTVYEIDDSFHPVARLDAQTARYIDGRWRYTQGTVRTLETGEVQSFDILDREHAWDLLELEVALAATSTRNMQKVSESKNYLALREYIRDVESAGYSSVPYRVELWNKVAFPFVCLVVPLVAIPFSLVPGRGGGLVRGLALSVVVAVVYFFLHSLSLAVGRAGRLSPVMAAWLTNAIFALVGAYRVLHIRQ